jgi:hypothetical protein
VFQTTERSAGWIAVEELGNLKPDLARLLVREAPLSRQTGSEGADGDQALSSLPDDREGAAPPKRQREESCLGIARVIVVLRNDNDHRACLADS